MRKSLLFLSMFAFAIGVKSQSYSVAMERAVKDSLLVLDFYIQKTAGNDFALGTSNFDVLLQDPHLNLSRAKFLPGEFDATLHPDSYEPMGSGSAHLLVMTVKAN